MSRPGKSGLVPDAHCNAQTRSGHPCRLRAGHGTEHQGRGRCKFHGGATPGGPPENEHAVKHGFTAGGWRAWLSDSLKRATAALDGEPGTGEGLQDAADTLARDAVRVEARLLALEARRRDLENEGRFNDAAARAYHGQVNDVERALARVRGLRSEIAARLPVPVSDDEPEFRKLCIPGGLTILFRRDTHFHQVKPPVDTPGKMTALVPDYCEVTGMSDEGIRANYPVIFIPQAAIDRDLERMRNAARQERGEDDDE